MKFIIILTMIFIATPAFAGGRHDDSDTQTINNFYSNSKSTDETGKAVLISAAVICLVPQAVYNYVWPSVVGLFTLSKPSFKSWNGVCWPEEAESTPAPNKDVTPNLKNGVRLYQ